MTLDEYRAKLEAAGIATKAPALDPSWTKLSTDEEPSPDEKIEVSEEDVPLEKRQASCQYTKSVILDKEETFVDWDVQMSPVVCATFGDMDITITSGYSVANLIGGSANLDVGLVKDYIGTRFGVEIGRAHV